MSFKIRFFERKSIKAKVLMIFTRQLATLIEAGIPLLRGLTILGRQDKDTVLQKVISSIGESVRGGAAFSESLKRHPTIFSELFVNMVQAGEVGGLLAPTLSRLAEFQERAYKLRNRVIATIAYPLITLLTAIIILCFLIGFIIPQFQSLLPEIINDKPLPPLTNFVISVSHVFHENFLVFCVGSFAFFLVFRYFIKTRKGKYLLDSWKLKFPLLGNLIYKQAISSFSRTLGTLLANGVPILQGLSLTRETIGNTCIGQVMDKIYDSVQGGESLNFPVDASKIFPPLVVSMIRVGEETGRLSEMLLKIADIYDDEIENTITGFTSLIEPLMIIFLAFVVGIIVITLFLPFISIADHFPTP